MVRVEMLPARHGDCLLVAYGEPASPHYVLIDGGTEAAFPMLKARLEAVGQPAPLDLVVVTHIDGDHIEGLLALFARNPGLLAPDDVWFNAYHHLFAPDRLGPRQGEGLSTAIEEAGYAWNDHFGGLSVVVPDEGELPTCTLRGGARLTLLSPCWKELERLRPKWERETKKAGLVPGQGARPEDVLGKRPPPTSLDVEALAKTRFASDRSAANGSSIAFLFEYRDVRILFGADAFAGVLEHSLRRYSAEPVQLAAVKVSHHGSKGNTGAKLLRRIESQNFLVSTSGDVFGHPDPEAIARIVKADGPKTLWFNYDSPYTRPWARGALQTRYDYSVELPESANGTLVVPL